MGEPVVLLTGATGFLGGATLTHLLLSGRPCRIVLLARGDSEKLALTRIATSVGRFTDARGVEPALRRCDLICGDLTDSQTVNDPRLDEVTHVLHLAANTSFRSVRSVRHTNILGTLGLAHRLRRARRLQRFLYVGTAYICGMNPPRVVGEDDYPRYGVRHLVEYTASKAECEMLLEATAPELPLVVARPSVVIGHSALGCLPSASIFWFFRAVDLLRRTNFSLDALNDVVPVDYAAAALLCLLFKPDLQYRRYHISAAESHSVTWHEIAAAFAGCYGERPDTPYRRVDFKTIVKERDRLRALFGEGDEDRLLMGLEIYYRFCEIPEAVFDNQHLLAEGMPPPPKFTDYLHLCATRPPHRSVYDQMLDDE